MVSWRGAPESSIPVKSGMPRETDRQRATMETDLTSHLPRAATSCYDYCHNLQELNPMRDDIDIDLPAEMD